MFDKNLAKAIIDIVIFLEFSNEEILDTDASIGALEQLAAELQQMPDEERKGLVSRFHELADEYGDKAKFVNKLAESLGLI